MAELLADGRLLPIGSCVLNVGGCVQGKVLKISPGEIWSNLEDQGEDASSKGRCGRCTTVATIAFVRANIGSVLSGLVRIL